MRKLQSALEESKIFVCWSDMLMKYAQEMRRIALETLSVTGVLRPGAGVVH